MLLVCGLGDILVYDSTTKLLNYCQHYWFNITCNSSLYLEEDKKSMCAALK